MASLIYDIQVNGPSKRKLNPAAAPIKRKLSIQGPSKLTKICGANASFVKKKNFAPTSVPVVSEDLVQTELQVENLVPEVETETQLQTENTDENQLQKAEGWKAKREKKKLPYGLKENHLGE